MKDIPSISPNLFELFEKNKFRLRSEQVERFNEIVANTKKITFLDFIDDLSILAALNATEDFLLEKYDLNNFVDIYSKFDIKLEPINGKCWFQENSLAFNINGFQFIKNFETEKDKNQSPKEFKESVYSFLNLYSNDLLKIKEFFLNKNYIDTWFMISGLTTLFIGNCTGYTAILYLNPKEKYKHHLNVQFKSNNIIFKGFKDQKIKVNKSAY